MKGKKKVAPYTMLFPFISSTLGLSGYAKETFAVLFNFWRQEEKPISASISTIQKITGGTRPAIVAAISCLEKRGLIRTYKSQGSNTLYEVTIDERVLQTFWDEYSYLVKRGSSQRSNHFTSTSKATEQQKEKRSIHKKNTTLRVDNKVCIGGLKEVKRTS